MAKWFDKLLGRKTEDPPALERAESSTEILQRTRLPRREVSLADVSIHRLGFNWAALKKLGIAVNQLQYTPLDTFDIQEQLRREVRPELYDAIPLVASAIAHHYNKRIPILKPNEAEIKAIKPMLETVAKLLSRLSLKWSDRFNRYIEKGAAEVIEDTATKVCTVVDGLGEIRRPREQFIPEIAGIYDIAATPQYAVEEDLFGTLLGEPQKQVEIPIERRIQRLLIDMRNIRNGYTGEIIPQRDYPLITWLLENSGFPPHGMDTGEASIAGSEIMQGIEQFLKRYLRDVQRAPKPSIGLDLFEPDTWLDGNLMRGLAETFAPEKLRDVRRALPNILEHARRFLPESGPNTRRQLQELAEDILILSKKGYTGEEIARALINMR